MLHPLAKDVYIRATRGMDAATLGAWVARFFGRLSEIDRIARREMRRPCAQDDIERLDLPMEVGPRRVRLWRPSVAGMTWLRTKAAEWWGNDVRRYTLALAYVCAHRGKDGMIEVWTRAGAWLRIIAWAKATMAGEEALRRAALSLLPPPDDSLKWFAMPNDGDGDDETDLMGVAAAITEKFGGTVEHWLWEVSDDDFWGAFSSLIDKAEAQDFKHEAPTCWWRRQRRALLKAEEKLRADTTEWIAEREARAREREEKRKARKGKEGCANG